MTDKTLAEPAIQEQIRMAFDADDKAMKNITLRRAADALDAKDAEIARLRKALAVSGNELSALGYYAHEGPMPEILTALRK
ncbi:hypothetical protein [Limimaricola cinnabarinus]|uniref:hypothetical protein n=1 Tax=Limimaricola cinnabarinus TaxID=1125964 RepID=UPI002491303D|nr:hypothetical protein [Limimaricola cinnabarinus]